MEFCYFKIFTKTTHIDTHKNWNILKVWMVPRAIIFLGFHNFVDLMTFSVISIYPIKYKVQSYVKR